MKAEVLSYAVVVLSVLLELARGDVAARAGVSSMLYEAAVAVLLVEVVVAGVVVERSVVVVSVLDSCGTLMPVRVL